MSCHICTCTPRRNVIMPRALLFSLSPFVDAGDLCPLSRLARPSNGDFSVSCSLLLSPRLVSSLTCLPYSTTHRSVCSALPLSNGSSRRGPNHAVHAQSSLGSPPSLLPGIRVFCCFALRGRISEGLDFGCWEMSLRSRQLFCQIRASGDIAWFHARGSRGVRRSFVLKEYFC
jgi:hypothetical protein